MSTLPTTTQTDLGIHPRFVLPGIENQSRPDQAPVPGVAQIGSGSQAHSTCPRKFKG